MQYGTLIEYNAWEGETWRFYFPISDLSVITRLQTHLKDENLTQEFRVLEDLTPEVKVDILVKHDPNTGYMPRHNKMTAEIDIKALEALSGEDLIRALYKGGIQKLVVSS